MDKTRLNQCPERDRTFWGNCLGVMNGAISGDTQCPSPARAPEGPCGPRPLPFCPLAGGGEGGRGPRGRDLLHFTTGCLSPVPEHHPNAGAGGGARPAALLPHRVCREVGKLSERATFSPGPAGGDVRCREGGVKAGKRQPQTPTSRPGKTAIYALDERLVRAAAELRDQPGPPQAAVLLAPHRPAQGFPLGGGSKPRAFSVREH